MKDLELYYFVGRCNPPHAGHIAILEEMLNIVRSKNNEQTTARAIILLGNGPKGKEMDNPIKFPLKEKIIRSKLNEYDKEQYDVQEIGSLVGDVVNFIARQIKQGSFNPTIKLVHFAGSKDEDAEKLNFIDKYASQMADTLGHILITETQSFALIDTQGNAFSATKVRADARVAASFDVWAQTPISLTKDCSIGMTEETYGMFYSEKKYNPALARELYDDENARAVYESIMEPTRVKPATPTKKLKRVSKSKPPSGGKKTRRKRTHR